MNNLASKQSDIKLLLMVSVACILLFVTVHFVAEPIISEIPVTRSDIRFNATKAYEYASKLATSFPNRHTGSDGAFQAFIWLQDELRGMGYEVYVQEFEVMIEDRRKGRNLYVIHESDRAEAVAVLANYDMAPMSFQAASDTAGQVGVLLELVRSIKEVSTNRAVVFALVDSEEWGCRAPNILSRIMKDRLSKRS
ncbi:MAG: M28 family peptidase [Candidatus Caldarchaeum sp.]